MNTNEEGSSLKKEDLEKTEINNDEFLNKETKDNKNKIISEENYTFGWSKYSEITNGRFAMLGFIAIVLIELISKHSFLNWAGIIH